MASHNTIQSAIDKKDFKKVQRLIEDKVGLERNDFPLICELVRFNQPDLIKLALNIGYSPLILDKVGQSALHLCVNTAHNPSLIELLMSKGGDINCKMRPPTSIFLHAHAHSTTPLHQIYWCHSKKVLEMTDELLRLGADPNLIDVNGQNTLHTLFWGNESDDLDFPFLEVVEKLVNAGVDVNHESNRCETPLMLLLRRQSLWPTARYLVLNGASLFTWDENNSVRSNFDFDVEEFEIDKEWAELEHLTAIYESKSVLEKLSSAVGSDYKNRL